MDQDDDGTAAAGPIAGRGDSAWAERLVDQPQQGASGPYNLGVVFEVGRRPEDAAGRRAGVLERVVRSVALALLVLFLLAIAARVALLIAAA